ncbi:acyl-CoA dehydrogenase family protein [Nocardia mexicana]|uniref:acyl-CoA dehydrogenase family protein n=1 Tax=Nocardia mexicana TaxID=279262 RepID=UPI000836369B|nr:acyl-CoA dehydrogenase family protein [Nocardia mexicana]
MQGLVVDTEVRGLLRGSVAKLAEKYGAGYFLERSRAGEKVDELWSDLGAAGLLGVHLPEEYGGGGAGLSELAVVIEELAAHGIPLLLTVISPAICGSIIAAHGSEEMKRAWLPGLAAGSKKMAFCLTEPDAGSNSHAVKTAARRDGEDWIISGGKYFISAADEADALLVISRAGGPAAATRNPLSLFVIPADSPGVTVQPLDTAVVSPDHQFTLFFDDVRVGPEALIGEPGNGLRQVFAGLNPERILAAAISSGIGRYAIDRAVRYARQRQVWSAPIGAHQGISHPLADCHIAVEQARLATYQAAALFDQGENAATAANIAKYAAAEASLKALDQSIQTHGGLGLSKEYGLAELWFVARLMRTAPVSREMVLNYVAQTTLGLPASY